jgi:NAD(P)-dependent dehydrogenase (short-subunit alcohol dehydrogenase family)
MDLHLNGKRALVTGGSRGIGKAVAASLIGEGARVAVLARTEGPLREAAAELGAVPVVANTGDDASVARAVNEAVKALGGLDILVNSAAQPGGQSVPPKLTEITDADFYGDVNVKVMGYLRCIREAVPHLAAAGGGRIVNLSGLAARQTGSVIGSVRNVAVAALTKNAADELAPLGIAVNVVHPGLVRTEATPRIIAVLAAQRGAAPADIEAAWGTLTDLGRIVTAEEVAAVVTFLASPVSIGINGDAVAVGGGAKGAIHY